MSPGISQSQSSDACSAQAASAAAGPAASTGSAAWIRRAHSATPPAAMARSSPPARPSSDSVSSGREWASRAPPGIGRSRSQATWNPEAPEPASGWSAHVAAATFQ